MTLAIEHDDQIAPATQPSPGARLLDEIHTFLCRYVAFPEPEQADAVALWVMHTHAFEAAEATPRLSIQSAEKQSGKTRLLELLDLLVRPRCRSRASPHRQCFGIIAEGPTTLLIDEADSIFDGHGGRAEDLRGLLNAGYRRGGAVARVGGRSKSVERFRVFAPVALAGIGALPDTVQDRSIIIRLKRRSASETVGKLRRREVEADAFALRAEMRDWCDDQIATIASHRPDIPTELGDRASDIWEPLARHRPRSRNLWAERASAAAIVLSARAVTDDRSPGARLLADIRRVLDTSDRNRIASNDLIARATRSRRRIVGR